ncbi:mannitol dehydrogenase family protein [Pseudaminobacter sp. 19-2017]|uniref:Mannitol dehydrogenase family protein n=1 Tax=Pseudaminobacter soli (ex Zhang et al. 2022) TaxID=2831468 RepID=A0A942E4K8_9HYPH|nr:mannitol dehydrogenase family protein [Pseudaminobacter soli]
MLPELPTTVARPRYDRAALKPGMAHLGVGAFHRSHQAEFTDDLLTASFDRWGVVGINVRPPAIEAALGPQDGLYTRLMREDDKVEARVIGSIVSVVDSRADSRAALEVLASPDIDVVTMTVTEKGYCHRPATGELILDHPDIVHDLAKPEAPGSVPGILVQALEMRRRSHGRPLTLMSCDNIPANGAILNSVVGALAERRDPALVRWIEANAAFPSSMVDRIAPAVRQADYDFVAEAFGYRDQAVVVGEPFRQWVIENRVAGRFPAWDRVGATLVDDVEAFEHLKMRVLNGAQTTLAYLGVFAGHEHTCDDMTDPLLVRFVRRMLFEETLPTLAPILGVDPATYVEQSLARLRNTAIRHRNHQIATDGSQKIVQRLLNPILERLRRGQSVTLLSVPVAAWMAYLIRASERFGRAWTADDPYAERIADIADRTGNDAKALADAILAIDTIFRPELAQSPVFRENIVCGLKAFLASDPTEYLRSVCEMQTLQLNDTP